MFINSCIALFINGVYLAFINTPDIEHVIPGSKPFPCDSLLEVPPPWPERADWRSDRSGLWPKRAE